jgi:predicted amidophosphoribosyltransferase
MAAQIVAGAPAGLLDGAALVPVPSHPSQRRARGFDPAEQLARALVRRTRLALSPCLRRSGAAARQLGASRAVRRRPGRVAIVVRGRAPARAVLVDDVHTTGATLHAAARALRVAGSGEVVTVTYARTLRRPQG